MSLALLSQWLSCDSMSFYFCCEGKVRSSYYELSLEAFYILSFTFIKSLTNYEALFKDSLNRPPLYMIFWLGAALISTRWWCPSLGLLIFSFWLLGLASLKFLGIYSCWVNRWDCGVFKTLILTPSCLKSSLFLKLST